MKGIRAGFPKYVFVVLLAVCVLAFNANTTPAQGVFNQSSLKGIYVITTEDRGAIAPAPGYGAALFDGLGNIAGGFVVFNMVNPSSPPDRMTVMARITGGSYTVDHPVGGMGTAEIAINAGPLGVLDLTMHFIITAATDTPVRLATEIFGIQDGIDPFSGGVTILYAKLR